MDRSSLGGLANIRSINVHIGKSRDLRNVAMKSKQERKTFPPKERNGTPLQHSCLENPMDKEAW